MRLFGLIGKPLTHSFSKSFFTDKFQRENLPNCTYENFELQSINELSQLINHHHSLMGLNVTIPYKEEVLQFLTSKSSVVEQIGACNCIKIVEKDLLGFNTDVIGFERSLLPMLQPHHTKALILGTGGSAKAVMFTLNKIGIKFTSVSRFHFGNNINYEMLTPDIVTEHTIIINTTPIGMHPHVDKAPPISYSLISKHHLLFDLIYNPSETLFLKKGREAGALVSNGYEMLVQQAEESWKIWNDPTF
jgi:shikimate dehydrogenase